jgi:TRAP-type uncharacterized transport system fused permease subunit
VGIFALSVAVVGYLKHPVGMVERVLYLTSALVLIKPGMLTDVAGGALLLALVLFNMRNKRV